MQVYEYHAESERNRNGSHQLEEAADSRDLLSCTPSYFFVLFRITALVIVAGIVGSNSIDRACSDIRSIANIPQQETRGE